MLNNPQKQLPLPATLRPGSFPLGSPESRAAARTMLAAKEAEAPALHVVVNLIASGSGTYRRHYPGGILIEIEEGLDNASADEQRLTAIDSPPTERKKQEQPSPTVSSQTTLPASQSTEPPRRTRPLVGAVGYLLGMR